MYATLGDETSLLVNVGSCTCRLIIFSKESIRLKKSIYRIKALTTVLYNHVSKINCSSENVNTFMQVILLLYKGTEAIDL